MDSFTNDVHVPVLQEEVIKYLQLKADGIYVDATIGLGGHARRILQTIGTQGRVIGFEWDEQAADIAARRLREFGSRAAIIQRSYAELAAGLREMNIGKIDGLLLDLGVSSLQLDRGARGFSFQVDAPLDMRMDSRLRETAADLVQRLSREELADIIYHYGEERQARRIAEFIVQAREKKKVETTGQLAGIVAAAIPRKFHPKTKHVATRTFQALRIAVNREFDNLSEILATAPSVLNTGARICVITFHSLEDRIVKQSFAGNPELRAVTRRPVSPGVDELANNPRARSAKLRVAEKVEQI
ncbi:MAG: 16S rRNA (cytosine(1402)-N(4))-methyltransferase RsmH [Desulfobulbaceae bacterium]|nr:16S rRNA (cytosine(1402)-N(4))-methyltransferase RsmH [Desulfobulbaceae bacterium]